MIHKIALLLSTYNGSKYLKSQLDSLVVPKELAVFIVARDDGSQDGTLDILQSDQSITLLLEYDNVGAKASFARLLEYALNNSDAQYLMFCDQDDVWHADKIEKTYRKMEELENAYGQDMPLLVHSDVSVADEMLHPISHSLWEHQHVNPTQISFHHFIVNNNVTGCTMMINRALAEKVKRIPQEAIMHDWWIAMVASAFGKIAFINEPLMLYRQHGANDTGAKKYGFRYVLKKLFQKPSFEKYIKQSQAFLHLYHDELNPKDFHMLQVFSQFGTMNKYQKVRVLFKYNIWKNGFLRNAGLVLFA